MAYVRGFLPPMMLLGFGGAANDKNCWKMNLLPFSKEYTNITFIV